MSKGNAMFFDGCVEYKSCTKTAAEIVKDISLSDWHDGYIAFSNDEMRLNDALKSCDLSNLVQDKVDGQLPDMEGYMMELDLWRQNGNVYEEISIEREGAYFFYQHWRLDTGKKKDAPNCFYKRITPLLRTTHTTKRLFPEGGISAMEVIVPEERLHFYITTGAE